MKTSELIGPALDWAVAKCEGYTEYCGETEKMLPPRKEYGWVSLFDYNYSTDWNLAGPIIEREKIGVYPSEAYEGMWAARNLTLPHIYGPTLLIAAMRCYVASKLGDEVEIPSELLP